MDSRALVEDAAVPDSSSKVEGDKIEIATVGGMDVVSSTSSLETHALHATQLAAGAPEANCMTYILLINGFTGCLLHYVLFSLVAVDGASTEQVPAVDASALLLPVTDVPSALAPIPTSVSASQVFDAGSHASGSSHSYPLLLTPHCTLGCYVDVCSC